MARGVEKSSLIRGISSNELIADKKFPHKFVVNFIASD